MRDATLLILVLAPIVACGGEGVRSDDDARRAYVGLDTHVDKAITLGFAGYNSAASANISPQMTTGVSTGTLTVAGQVDQGASDNKDGKLTYDTDATAPPALDMSLKSIPTGTLAGTLIGAYSMTGDLKGSVTLNVTFTGTLQAGTNTTVERVPGSTHITGTAVSPAGTYQIDVTR
jgi:hypothetical protein